MSDCPHPATRAEAHQHSFCRYVPKGWPERDDNDPYETHTVTDTYVYCTVCNELLEVIAGD